MRRSDEYLEKVFSEGLKREIDSDESVWRTLPFFATAIGITGTLLGYDGSQLPPPSLKAPALLLYILFVAAIGCLTASFAWLFNAVRQREYRYPPSEIDLHKLAADYQSYHAALGVTGEALDDRVVGEMRAVMVDEYAQSASANRQLNRAKLFSRSQAIFYLMAGLAICFAYGSLAFVEQKLALRPGADGGGVHGPRRDEKRPSPPTSARAGTGGRPAAHASPPPASSDDQGGRAPVRSYPKSGRALSGRGS